MTEGYDYYDTEILLNGIPVGGLSQHGYLGTAGFGPAPKDCYFNIPIPLQLKVGRINLSTVSRKSKVRMWRGVCS